MRKKGRTERKMQIIAQIIGAVAIAENILIYISNRRERILLFKFLSDLLWFVNYLLMGGVTGAVLNAIAMGRETVFLLRQKAKWAEAKWIPALFLLLTWISPVIEWISKGALTFLPILPAIGSMIFVIGFYAQNTVLTKTSSLFGNALWLTYAILIGNITGMLSNVLMIISAVIGLIRERAAKKKLERDDTGENNG